MTEHCDSGWVEKRHRCFSKLNLMDGEKMCVMSIQGGTWVSPSRLLLYTDSKYDTYDEPKLGGEL